MLYEPEFYKIYDIISTDSNSTAIRNNVQERVIQWQTVRITQNYFDLRYPVRWDTLYVDIPCVIPYSEMNARNLRLYSKSSLTLKECFWIVGGLVSYEPNNVTTHPPAIQKQHWHSREVQIEHPLFECEREWAFRIQAIESL